MKLKFLLIFLMMILCTFTIEHRSTLSTESEYKERILKMIDSHGKMSEMEKEKILGNMKIAGGKKNTMNPGVITDEL